MKKLVLGAGLCICISVLAAEPAGFIGKVVVELLDDIEYDHQLRLVEDFGFRDPDGRVWLARKSGIIDGV